MYSFHSIYKYYRNYNDFNFHDTIKYRNNVQGCCGIFKCKGLEIADDDNEINHSREIIINFLTDKVFYKYGIYNMTLGRREYVVSNDLFININHFPNFLRPIIYLKNIFIRNDSCKNPFEINIYNKNLLKCVDIVVYEYLNYSCTFHDFLKKKIIIDINIYNSIIMQLCIALIASQQKINFVHNDLHSNNIVFVKCNRNLRIFYNIMIDGEIKNYIIPTFGYIPIIIDYGFAYSEDCKNMSLECANSDHNGMITYDFDSLSDFIRLYVVLYNSPFNQELKNYVYDIIHKLPISMKSSWEKITGKDSMYYVDFLFINAYRKIYDNISSTYIEEITRLICRNIILPITYCRKYKNLNPKEEIYKFLIMWAKIEKWAKYEYEKIYLLRQFTDHIRKYNDNELIITKFKESMNNILNRDIPVDINWNNLIINFKKCINSVQNIIYENMNLLKKKRQQMLYSKLISGENMFINIIPYIYKEEEKYTFQEKDTILVIDNILAENNLLNIENETTMTMNDLKNYLLNINK